MNAPACANSHSDLSSSSSRFCAVANVRSDALLQHASDFVRRLHHLNHAAEACGRSGCEWACIWAVAARQSTEGSGRYRLSDPRHIHGRRGMPTCVSSQNRLASSASKDGSSRQQKCGHGAEGREPRRCCCRSQVLRPHQFRAMRSSRAERYRVLSFLCVRGVSARRPGVTAPSTSVPSANILPSHVMAANMMGVAMSTEDCTGSRRALEPLDDEPVDELRMTTGLILTLDQASYSSTRVN